VRKFSERRRRGQARPLGKRRGGGKGKTGKKDVGPGKRGPREGSALRSLGRGGRGKGGRKKASRSMRQKGTSRHKGREEGALSSVGGKRKKGEGGVLAHR